MIDLLFLIPTVIPQILNHTEELLKFTVTPVNEINVALKTHPLTANAKIRIHLK